LSRPAFERLKFEDVNDDDDDDEEQRNGENKRGKTVLQADEAEHAAIRHGDCRSGNQIRTSVTNMHSREHWQGKDTP
jgi:hypothetical protein